jgi:rubredoxin
MTNKRKGKSTMGLGPAVCLKCLQLASFIEEGEQPNNGLTKFGHWACKQCGGTYKENRTLNSLFCIPKEKWATIDKNSGTNFCELLEKV